MSQLIKIRLIKAYMQPDGKIIPRGKVIEVTEDIAVYLETLDPVRAERIK